jgi:zinc/manganese transport system substrate-binding protein
MSIKKYIGFYVCALALLLQTVSIGVCDNPVRVVTTLSTFADIARSVGGDRVIVESLAPPVFNPHFFEVRPSHILKLKRADLFLHAGLDLEMWRGPMTDAAARPEVRAGGARELDLSRTVSLAELPTGSLTRAQGDIHLFGNPHYWLDPHNGIKLGAEIAKKLTEVDPAGEKLYQLNYQKFATDVENHILVWQTRAKSAAIRNFIGYHNEWVYLIDFLGGKMGYYMEPKPGIPPSAKHIEELLRIMQGEKFAGIVQASYSPVRSSQELSDATKVPLLILCQNVGELPACDSYVRMLEYDIGLLLQ